MNSLSKFIAVALGAAALANPAFAEAGTIVKVALLDISATVGQGMMGQGMMGQGFGFGMMGMMGRGGSSPGMMGPGMMALRADKTAVEAGSVSFEVTNWSRSIVHEMLVVAVDSADAPLPYDYNKQIVMEDQVKSLGETAELQPNSSKTLDLDLAPGSYLLICNVPGHYAAGMVLPFTVAP